MNNGDSEGLVFNSGWNSKLDTHLKARVQENLQRLKMSDFDSVFGHIFYCHGCQ